MKVSCFLVSLLLMAAGNAAAAGALRSRGLESETEQEPAGERPSKKDIQDKMKDMVEGHKDKVQDMIKDDKGKIQAIVKRSLDRANDMLGSETCEPFVEALAKKVGRLTAYRDDLIIEYVCNPIQRDELKAGLKKMGDKLVKVKLANYKRKIPTKKGFKKRGPRMLMLKEGEEKKSKKAGRCLTAFGRVLLKHKKKIHMSLMDNDDCKKQVRFELRELEAGEAEGEEGIALLLTLVGALQGPMQRPLR